mgnify:CR=1 FL=1
MIEVTISFVQIGPNDYAANIDGLSDFLTATGEAGRVHLVGCLEAITNHIKHGPSLVNSPGVLQ